MEAESPLNSSCMDNLTINPISPLSASESMLSQSGLLTKQANGTGSTLHFSTLCATVDNPDPEHRDPHGASSVPIYQSSTFKGIDGRYDYTRSGNPSRTFLQNHVAKISSAKHAFAVSSGMAALDVILRILKPGDEIIAGSDLYGGSNRLLGYIKEHNQIDTHHIDTTSLQALEPFLVKDSRVRMVLLESPTNPLLQIVDIQEIINRVKAVIPEAMIVVDNTMMSPYLMKPLEFGADIVYDSGTKYLSGHHDLMAGLVICNSDRIATQLKFIINSIGNGLAPFECFLLTRGMKTLSLRLDRQQASAVRIANYLNGIGFKVNFPGLPHHKGKQIHDRLARGPGAVLSFQTDDTQISQKIVSSTRLWSISVSFGCVNSLISMPCMMSHASIDPAVRAARNLPEDLIRLCVGIEEPDDLLEDLQSALIEAGAIRILDETSVESGFERVKPKNCFSPSSTNSETMIETTQLDSARNPSSLLVSAPGKIILFGEHAVVFGKKAIAAAINLRCYCLVEPVKVIGGNETVTLNLPDSGWVGTWSLDQLPWDHAGLRINESTELQVDPQLSKVLLSKAAEKAHQPSLVKAAHAFLYLFVNLAENRNRRPQIFTVRSTLPIGAGLGSSASYSVCLASALLYTHEHIVIPAEQRINQTEVEIINRWAFLGEKILHGSPSGVDNTVSSYGGAICFQKEMNSINHHHHTPSQQNIEKITGFEAIKLLITDTTIPRDTKSLVAGVANRKKEESDYIQNILNEIDEIATRAREALMQLNANEDDQEIKRNQRSQVIKQLSELMELNHLHLSSLGVSHEKLELVKETTQKIGLKTKLTGAGGGGCSITLIQDEFNQDSLDATIAEIIGLKMKTYQTQVGVDGFGYLRNFGNMNDLDLSIKKKFMQSSLSDLNSALLNVNDSASHSSNHSSQNMYWSFA